MTTLDDAVTAVRERVAETRRIAQAVLDAEVGLDTGGRWRSDMGMVRDDHGWRFGSATLTEDTDHAARHDPTAVLAQCDVVELLLDEATQMVEDYVAEEDCAARLILIAADLTGTTGPAIDALRAEAEW